MRILVHDYAGHPFQVQLSRELASRGHEVTHAFAGGLLTPRGSLEVRQDDSNRFRIAEVPMSPDYRSNKYSFFKRRGYELAYGKELAALVGRSRPDVIISGNTPTEPQWTMIKAARKATVPFVSWLQDFYSVAVDRLARDKLPVLGALVGAYYRRLDTRSLRACAGVVAITEDFLPILKEFGVQDERVSVIPNWAPLDELPRKAKHNAWAVRQGLADKFVFLYSGTLAMKHNPDLIWALAQHFKADLQVRVVVISEGPGAEYLQAKMRREAVGNLDLLPYQPFKDMPDVLGTADVLLSVLERNAGVFSVPSKVLTYHTAERAILGAMPAENLATRIMVKQGSGLCVEPDNIEGFVEQAERLREDLALREGLARRARAYAEAEFPIETIADRFERAIARAQKAGSCS